MRSWQVQLASALAWLGVVPGVFCLYIAYKAFTSGNDMLLIVMPIVGSAALIGGFILVSGAASVAIGWAAFCAAVSLGWPHTQEARMCRELADAARSAARERGAPIGGYRDYLNGVSWERTSSTPREPLPCASSVPKPGSKKPA